MYRGRNSFAIFDQFWQSAVDLDFTRNARRYGDFVRSILKIHTDFASTAYPAQHLWHPFSASLRQKTASHHRNGSCCHDGYRKSGWHGGCNLHGWSGCSFLDALLGGAGNTACVCGKCHRYAVSQKTPGWYLVRRCNCLSKIWFKKASTFLCFRSMLRDCGTWHGQYGTSFRNCFNC